MSFFSSFECFTGMLFGSDDLRELRYIIKYIIKDVSFLSVGVKKKVFVFV